MPGVIPVWGDLIQWLSSLLIFVKSGRKSAWRIWCERALRLARWFEECSNLVYVRAARASHDECAHLLGRFRNTKPSHPADPPNLRVKEDLRSRRTWQAEMESCFRLQAPDSNMLRRAIIRDTHRYCNIIFSRRFLETAGVDPHEIFGHNRGASRATVADYDLVCLPDMQGRTPDERDGIARAIHKLSPAAKPPSMYEHTV